LSSSRARQTPDAKDEENDAMTKLNAGTPVKRGYYFSMKNWSVNPIEKDGTVLHGEAGEQFVPVPLPVAVMLAPVLGAVFLMFMPFIGFYLTAQTALRPVARMFKKSTTEIAASMSGLQPGEAHLTGRPGEEKAEGGETPAPLSALEKEIAAKRAEKNGKH
jgi:hypothetical protein